MKKWTQDAWAAVKGDGCTGIPDLWMESPCTRHDRHYTFHTHKDGTPITRFDADVELMKDAWKALPLVPEKLTWQSALLIPLRGIAKVVVPPVVFLGVRVGGGSHW